MCGRPSGRTPFTSASPTVSRGRNQKPPGTHQDSALRGSAPSPARLTGKPFRAAVWLSFSSTRSFSVPPGSVDDPGCSRCREAHSPRRPRLNGLPLFAALRPDPLGWICTDFVRDSLAWPGVPSSPGFGRWVVRLLRWCKHRCFHVEPHRDAVLSSRTLGLTSVVAELYPSASSRRTGRANLLASGSTGRGPCAGGHSATARLVGSQARGVLARLDDADAALCVTDKSQTNGPLLGGVPEPCLKVTRHQPCVPGHGCAGRSQSRRRCTVRTPHARRDAGFHWEAASKAASGPPRRQGRSR